MKTLSCFVLALMAIAIALQAQETPPELSWRHIYNAEYNGDGKTLVKTLDGGYAIVGNFWSFTGNPGMVLMKTDSFGNLLWSHIWQGEDIYKAYSLSATVDGGYAIVGQLEVEESPFFLTFLIKTDTSGNEELLRTYDLFFGEDIKQTSDNGFIIMGNDYSPLGGDITVYLLKTNAEGDSQWCYYYGDEMIGNKVLISPDEGYMVMGNDNSSYSTPFLFKTDDSGNLIWERDYQFTTTVILYDICPITQGLNAGGYALVGYLMGDFVAITYVNLIIADSIGNMTENWQWGCNTGGS